MRLAAINAIDLYKADHRNQYPSGTEFIYSNFTPRANHLAPKSRLFDGKVVVLGLQGVIQWLFVDLFNDTFFGVDQETVVAKYKKRMDKVLGPDAIDVSHIKALHSLGYLPFIVKSLPEGSAVDVKTPIFTVQNTHKDFAWLTNYVESVLSAEVWKTCTTASTARQFRMLLDDFACKTGCAPESVLFQAHDFSFRGMSGMYDSAQSSIGHLLAFRGSDTLLSYDYIDEYYPTTEFIGGGVPATEHSVMCAGGKVNELETFKRLITEIYPRGIVSIVSDTWNFWNVVEAGGIVDTLKQDILARDGKVVIRPDSGDPESIICGSVEIIDVPYHNLNDWVVDYLTTKEVGETPHGECGNCEVEGYFRCNGVIYKCVVELDWNRYDKQYYYIDGSRLLSSDVAVLTSEQKGALQCLWEVFGGEVNGAGFKVLDSHIGLIYGDSITLDRADKIFTRMVKLGFASSNLVVGVGSYTYQHVTRDSYGFAMKATHAVVNGENFEIFKDPITDVGTKKSAKGYLRVEKENNKFVLYDQQTSEQEKQGELKVVFIDGIAHNTQSFDQVRKVFEESL